MQVFSDMARRYGIYIVGSNNQPPFRESSDPSEIATFADPDLREPPRSVFVATDDTVYNEAFIWGPSDVREEGPWPLRNVVAQNKKVPLTDLEELLQVSNGPSTGADGIANLRPYRLAGTKARLGIATSLPAFQFGYGFGEPPPGVDPCSDTRLYYMRCLNKLGANVVIQDEANPGPWAVTQPGGWQPLEWMGSSWRHVGDPSVHFAYNVTPFMVGNLADLVFDGQSSIAQRGKARGSGCNYVGTRRFHSGPPENDPAAYRPYAGRSASSSRLRRGLTAMDRGTSSARSPSSSRPARAIRWRTTTSKLRWSPTCPSRWTIDGRDACADLEVARLPATRISVRSSRHQRRACDR